jgi:hypothetical protein
MRRTRQTDDALPPYPERLYRTAAWAEFATGALAYFDTGMVDPNDSACAQLENYMKQKWNRSVLGLTGGMNKNGDPHGESSFYVNFSEDIWHRNWLIRGEIEKAILTFYSMLAYGMDKDTYGTVERFHLSESRYAPFYMDTSASARVCGLIRQALILESAGELHLLPGVPRAWLQHDRRIEIRGGETTFAKFNLFVQARTEDHEISVTLEIIEVREDRLPLFRLRLPHPERKMMRAVELNGGRWSRVIPEREVVEFDPGSGETVVVAHF